LGLGAKSYAYPNQHYYSHTFANSDTHADVYPNSTGHAYPFTNIHPAAARYAHGHQHACVYQYPIPCRHRGTDGHSITHGNSSAKRNPLTGW
jgi:hypothetical protein